MTTRRRPRARSTASSAPPKTLWSVTAIAPSPCASAWSSSSSTSIEQSCDQLVCRWRSATDPVTLLERLGREVSRAPARGEPLVDRLDAVGERFGASAPPRPRGSSRLAATRKASSSISRAVSAAASSGCSARAGRGSDRSAGSLRLGNEARRALRRPGRRSRRRGTARRGRLRCARSERASVPRSSREMRRPRRRASACAAARAPSRAAPSSSRTSARRSGRSRLPPLQYDEPPLLAGSEQLGIDPVRHELVAAGEAHGGGVGDLLVRRERARRCGRAGARAARGPAGSRAARPRRTSPP